MSACSIVVETEPLTSFWTEYYPETMPGRFSSPVPLPSSRLAVKTRSLEAWAQTATSLHCTVWQSEKRASTTVSASKTDPKSAAIPSLAAAGELFQTWWRTTRNIAIYDNIDTGCSKESMAVCVFADITQCTDMYPARTKRVVVVVTSIPRFGLDVNEVMCSAMNASKTPIASKESCRFRVQSLPLVQSFHMPISAWWFASAFIHPAMIPQWIRSPQKRNPSPSTVPAPSCLRWVFCPKKAKRRKILPSRISGKVRLHSLIHCRVREMHVVRRGRLQPHNRNHQLQSWFALVPHIPFDTSISILLHSTLAAESWISS